MFNLNRGRGLAYLGCVLAPLSLTGCQGATFSGSNLNNELFQAMGQIVSSAHPLSTSVTGMTIAGSSPVPGDSGASSVCTSEQICQQTRIPFFDEQLNLGALATPAAAADYPCVLNGVNVCQLLIPTRFTQTIHFSKATAAGTWGLKIDYEQNTISTPSFTSATTPDDIDNAFLALDKSPIGHTTATGAFPDFTLTYDIEPSLASGSGLKLTTDLTGATGRSRLRRGSYSMQKAACSAARLRLPCCFRDSSTISRIGSVISSRGVSPVLQFPKLGHGTGPYSSPNSKDLGDPGRSHSQEHGRGSGGGIAGVGDAKAYFKNATESVWRSSLTTYNGLPNDFDGTTAAYLNMRNGYLSIQLEGFYTEIDTMVSGMTEVTFTRHSGHFTMPMGYKRTQGPYYNLSAPLTTAIPQSLVSGAPYALSIQNPEVPGVVQTEYQGIVTGGSMCLLNKSPVACPSPNTLVAAAGTSSVYSYLDVELPDGATALNLVSDKSPSTGGHEYSFVDATTSLGIPPAIQSVIGGIPVLPPADLPTLATTTALETDSSTSDALGGGGLADIESSIDSAAPSLTMDTGSTQALSSLRGSHTTDWGARLGRLFLAPKMVAAGLGVDNRGLSAHYAALAHADPSGFAAEITAAYQRLSQEPTSGAAHSLRWAWLHPRHALRGLIAQYASIVAGDEPEVQAALQKLATAEVMQTPNAPVIDPQNPGSDEATDMVHSFAGAMTPPVTAYRLLVTHMTADAAIPFTVSVLQHQPHYAVRNAIRGHFKNLFPASVAALESALQAAGQE